MVSATVTLILFLNLAIISIACAAYTPPSTLSKFHHVLRRAKRQAPDSSTAVFDLFGFADWYWHLQGGEYMQFQIRGKEARSELRQMTTGGSNAAWSVSSSNTLTANVALPVPVSDTTEFTFLQVHCGSGPALRINWFKEYDSHTDGIFATVRTGSGSSDVYKRYLGQRNTGTTSFKIRVQSSKVSVWMGGSLVLNEASLSYWGGNSCYFKAGAYINNPKDSSTTYARTKFRELYWP